jgi:CheY-like chemotaxis protein
MVHDEAAILEMLGDALGEYGYVVETASNGEAALQRMAANQYDLALCDWKMPGLNGREVYEQLRTVNPEMRRRMIFITGDVINERTQKFLRDENKLRLSKPFALSEFRAAVEQAIAN